MTDADKQLAVIEDACVLPHEGKISTVRELLPLLDSSPATASRCWRTSPW